MRTLIHCLLAALLVTAPSPTLADAAESIAYIRSLLAQGKKISVLVIDMQTEFEESFLPSEKTRVLQEQLTLLNELAHEPNLHFTEVKWFGQGNTIESIYAAISRSVRFSTFEKMTSSAFEMDSIAPLSPKDTDIQGLLAEHLKSLGVTDVFTMGCYASSCIIDTAEGALQAGLNVAYDRDLNIVVEMSGPLDPPADFNKVRRQAKQEWKKLESEYKNLQRVGRRSRSKCSLQ